MKIKITLFLLCVYVLGYSQQNDITITPSSWIGTIKMGDANPELVFNIFIDSTGKLTGNLGVPSKGIQGIALSKVLIEEDSIILEIADAQASFNGVFEKDRAVINGVWKEGENSYPLTLLPLKEKIDYENFKKENTTSLNLEFTSEHFNLYSKQGDAKVLASLANTLESNYVRITSDMETSFNSKIDVFIYPDLKAFHNAINYPDAQDWVVGAASKNELKMVSPLKPGSVHSYESLMKAIVHELAHAVVLNFRKQGLAGLPNWLNEGYAYYEAQQLTESQREVIYSSLLKNTIPSWNEIEMANTSQFGAINGYPLSATIIEFLVESYGLDKLKQFIIKPESAENIYGISKQDLEKLWLEHLRNYHTG